MRRPFVAIGAALFALVSLTPSAGATDYECQKLLCFASIPNGATLKRVAFTFGEMVSTQDGWIVSESQGWVEI